MVSALETRVHFSSHVGGCDEEWLRASECPKARPAFFAICLSCYPSRRATTSARAVFARARIDEGDALESGAEAATGTARATARERARAGAREGTPAWTVAAAPDQHPRSAGSRRRGGRRASAHTAAMAYAVAGKAMLCPVGTRCEPRRAPAPRRATLARARASVSRVPARPASVAGARARRPSPARPRRALVGRRVRVARDRHAPRRRSRRQRRRVG